MKAMLIGGILVVLGVFCFIVGVFYSWLLATPNVEGELYSRYELLSNIFGYFSYLMLGLGVIAIVRGIRKENRKYHKEKRKEQE